MVTGSPLSDQAILDRAAALLDHAAAHAASDAHPSVAGRSLLAADYLARAGAVAEPATGGDRDAASAIAEAMRLLAGLSPAKSADPVVLEAGHAAHRAYLATR